MLSNRLIIVGTVALTVFVALSTCQRSSYGEICSKTQRCDRRSWLGCISGKCDCVKPDEMVFEPSTRKCASKAGERCKYALEHSDGSKSFEYTSCVENSICGADGFCSCGADYYENDNSTCSPTRKYSETCDSKANCSSPAGLACVEGVCKCNDDKTSYSLHDNQCVGLVGHACVLSRCTKNAKCFSTKCVCEDGYYQNSDDGCSLRLDVLENCTTDDQCKYEGGLLLKCVDGTCNCDPDTSLFGTGRKHRSNPCSRSFYKFYPDSYTQCLGKVGSPCIDDLCAPGAYCQYIKECLSTGPGTCKCRPGYSQTSFGTCGRRHGEECSSAGICLDGLVCDRHTNQCSCRYASQHFDTKCKSRVGGPCDSISGCVQGGECVKVRNSSRGSCQCREGYGESTSGTCEASFGMPCDSARDCNNLWGLHCIDDICQCEDFKEFSLTTKTCLGLAGSRCVLNATSQQCVQNSNCLKTHSGLSTGHCTCITGHMMSVNYTCESENPEGTGSENVPVLSFPVDYDVDTSEGEESD